MYRYSVIISIILFCLIPGAEAQDIKTKKHQLTGIEKELRSLESELKSKNRTEKKSLELIENYNRQNFLLNDIISQMRQAEAEKARQIEGTEYNISAVEKKISRLKETYSKYIVYLYKHGNTSLLKAVFGSENIGQALVRYKYLQKISEQRASDLNELKTSRERLTGLKTALIRERDEKRQLTRKKENEETRLVAKIQEKKSMLQDLKADKDALKKEIELKRQAQVEIRNIISQLVAEDNRRKKEEKAKQEKAKLEARRKRQQDEAKRRKDAERIASMERKSKKNENSRKSSATENTRHPATIAAEETALQPNSGQEHTNQSVIDDKAGNADEPITGEPTEFSSSAFSSLKGRLNWPLSGSIIRKFGQNRNQKLNTVTISYGIDINARPGALDVRSVGEGTVSSINWVPGYGSVVIITHAGGYRTVYGHLEEIYAGKGSRVSSGSVIGKVGEGLEGYVLHFEVWNERQNLNPEQWLR